MKPAVALLLLLLSLAFAAPTTATAAAATTVELSYPLGERYRVGRYIPVRVNADALPAKTLVVGGPGAVPCELTPDGAGRVSGVIPVLSVLPIETIVADAANGRANPSFKPLDPQEALIATTTSNAADAQAVAVELFPAKRIVSVQLDAADPLPGPPMAWDALDALVLDAAGAARVSQETLAVLLSAGTTIAVRSDTRLTGDWPWQRRGPWWILRAHVAGPTGVIEPAAYMPIEGSSPGYGPATRRTVVLICGGFALALIALSLWRSRRGWIAVVVLAFATAGGLLWWGARQHAATATAGKVLVRSPVFVQEDEWSFRIAIATGEAQPQDIPASALVRPVFASAPHFRSTQLALHCDADGRPTSLRARLHKRHQLAFLTRAISPAYELPPSDVSNDSPLLPLVRAAYLSADARIVRTGRFGYFERPGWQTWPHVLIERPTPAPAPATAPAAQPR